MPVSVGGECVGGQAAQPGRGYGRVGVAIAEYPEDFPGIFPINYAAMKYQLKNDQLTQLDGDKARMDIGREECKVYMQGAEDKPALAVQMANLWSAAGVRPA